MNTQKSLSAALSFTIALAAITILCVNLAIPYHALVLVSVMVMSLTMLFLPEQILVFIIWCNKDDICDCFGCTYLCNPEPEKELVIDDEDIYYVDNTQK
jgi:hypothetical protein